MVSKGNQQAAPAKKKVVRSKGGVKAKVNDPEWGTDNSYPFLKIEVTKLFPRSYIVYGATRFGGTMVPVLYARRTPFLPRKRLRFYSDPQYKNLVFQFQARLPWLTAVSYDIVDMKDGRLGSFSKNLGKSFANAEFKLETPYLQATGKDTQSMINAFRRVVNFGGDVNFIFYLENTKLVAHVTREWESDDPYMVQLEKFPDGRQLDWRVGAALGCALDLLLNKSV